MRKNVMGMILVSMLLIPYSLYASTTDDLSVTKVSQENQTEVVKENASRIDQLEQTIEELKHDNVQAKNSLSKRIIIAGVLFLIGGILFLFLRIGLKKFEDIISEKEAIRESNQVLRIKTIVRLFHWIGSIAIVCTTFYMTLANFDVNVAPLLAGAGIVGLAFGFGGQYLIRDLINGVFILLEGHYGVNDIVKIGEHAGVVENINLRITVLRDAEGRMIIIPNGDVKAVVNLTKDYSRTVLNIGVAYKENVDHVMDVIKKIGIEIREDITFGKLILEDLEMLGVDDFADSQVTIRFRIKTLPSKQFDVAREMRRRIKNRFDELGIEIPFPHRTLYLGAGADNDLIRNLAQRPNVKI